MRPLGDNDAVPGDTPTPEARDNYVSSELIFPHNGKLTKGHIVSCKCIIDGYPIEWAHSSPVLDTRLYLMEFEDGDITELTANTIAESMYSQCNRDCNMYLLLDTFVDFRKMIKAVSFDKQAWTNTTGHV